MPQCIWKPIPHQVNFSYVREIHWLPLDPLHTSFSRKMSLSAGAARRRLAEKLPSHKWPVMPVSGVLSVANLNELSKKTILIRFSGDLKCHDAHDTHCNGYG